MFKVVFFRLLLILYILHIYVEEIGGIRGFLQDPPRQPDSGGPGFWLAEVMAAYGLLNSDNSNEGAGKPSTVLVMGMGFPTTRVGWQIFLKTSGCGR